MKKTFLNKSKNGFVSFWANCPNMKKEGKPYIYKTEYQELGSEYVSIKKYSEYHNLNEQTVCSAIARGKIPFKASRRKRYIDINFEYKAGHLRFLHLLEDMETIFTETRCYKETSRRVGVEVTAVRGYLKIFLQDNPHITLKKRRPNLKYSDEEVEDFKKVYEKIRVYKYAADELGIKATTLRSILLRSSKK